MKNFFTVRLFVKGSFLDKDDCVKFVVKVKSIARQICLGDEEPKNLGIRNIQKIFQVVEREKEIAAGQRMKEGKNFFASVR